MDTYIINDEVYFNELVKEDIGLDFLKSILLDDGCIAVDEDIISFELIEYEPDDILSSVVRITDIY